MAYLYDTYEPKVDDELEYWRTFHNQTREYVVFMLFFITLYISSYCLISKYKKKWDFYFDAYEDALAHRISLWMSTFSLGVSIGASLLLPISIISNEVLLYYPNSYYVQWLNSSLIQGLWNLVFLFSNVALFILLPFAHFFIESEGLPGSPRGIMARVYEVMVVLALTGLLVMGITYIISAILEYAGYNTDSDFSVSNFYLPFLYSCISFFGVLTLLLCTPVGFARLFTVVGELLLKPKHHLNSYTYAENLEKQRALRESRVSSVSSAVGYFNKHIERHRITTRFSDTKSDNCMLRKTQWTKSPESAYHRMEIGNGSLSSESDGKNLLYPSVMLLLLGFTTMSVLMVTQNTLELCFGLKNLPIYSQNFSLGIKSLSALGPIGAASEIAMIAYLWCTSIVGFYSLPVLKRLKPKPRDTSMTQVIGNCAVLLILSSALPVLARSLGITNFDLLGDFGRIHWLGSFYVVLFQNIVFVVAAVLCLGTKMTAAVRQELFARLCFFRGSFTKYGAREPNSM